MASNFKIDAKFGALVMAGLFLVVVGQIIPFIGTVMEDATPAAGATSEWNNTYRADVNGTYAGDLLPSMADTWGTLVTILGGALSLSAIFYAISPIIGKNLGMG